MADRDYMRADFGSGGGFRHPFWQTYPGTKGIVIGLVGIHVVMALIGATSPRTYDAIHHFLLLQPELALKKLYIWQLVTCGLFHERGIWHLLMNCLMIYIFGRMVERRLGLRRLLLFALATQVTASLAFLLESAVLDQTYPMLGASGYALGVTVLAALWFPHTPVLPSFVLSVPLWVVATIIVISDYLYMLQMPGGVAHSAHLGGAAYAFIYWKYGGGVERVFDAIDNMADRQRIKRERKAAKKEAELRREVDRILDKVNRDGMAALSDEERRFLKEASEKLRR